MAERVATLADAADAFRRLADAEGARIPTYARICRIIADDPELHGLLLEAPTGQRLPVLLLAALHDVVLGEPDGPLAPWYPSVSGAPPAADDPGPALRTTVAAHRDELLSLLRTRQVQTNEVNRCGAWWLALGSLTDGDDRPVHLVELGASAGLNLLLDRYTCTIAAEPGADVTGPGGPRSVELGRPGSPVRLETTVRGDDPALTRVLARRPTPRIVSRVGLDQRPADVVDPADARWLEACVWPEQQVRLERLRAALALAAPDPPRVERGDLVDDLPALLDEAPDGSHVIVLSSWVLAYVSRSRREALRALLQQAAADLARRHVRLSLATLEADTVLDWVTPPPLHEDATADERFGSILAVSEFGVEGRTPAVTVLARCQAHLVWADLLH